MMATKLWATKGRTSDSEAMVPAENGNQTKDDSSDAKHSTQAEDSKLSY
jgi:hypothetical protein